MSIKDLRPEKDLEFIVRDIDLLKKVETAYTDCSNNLSCLLSLTNDIQDIINQNKKLASMIEENQVKVNESRETYAHETSKLMDNQHNLYTALVSAIKSTLSKSDIEELNNLIKENNGLVENTLDDLLIKNLKSGFVPRFIDGILIVNTPSAVISRFLKDKKNV